MTKATTDRAARRDKRREKTEKKLHNAEDDAVILLEEFADSDGLTAKQKAAVLNQITELLEKVTPAVKAGVTVEEVIAQVLGTNDTDRPAGELDVPNRDIAEEVGVEARRELQKIDPIPARERAVVAIGVLGGSVEIAGRQVKAVTDLSDAIKAKEKAESDLKNYEALVGQMLGRVKSAIGTREIPSGRMATKKETIMVFDASKLNADDRKALGL